MNPQPNFERLSEVFVIASQEVARIANIPSFDNGQRIFTAITALTNSINRLSTDVTSLKGDVTSLKGDVISLKGDVTTLTTNMNSRFRNLEIRMDAALE